MHDDKKENGAIVVEASILLPIFIFIFLTFFSVVKICVIEAKVQNALTNAAKQISSYSYVYSFTGAKGVMDNLNNDTQAAKKDIKENVVDNIVQFSSGVDNVISSGKESFDEIQASGMDDLKSTANSLKEFAGDVQANKAQIENSAKKIFNYFKQFKDPKKIKEFLFSVVKMFASDGAEILKSMLGGILAEKLCVMACTDDSDREFFENIDYSKSQLFPGTSNEIILVAEYSVRIAPYIPVDLKYTISQKAVTRGWLDGDGGQIQRNGIKITALPVKQKNKTYDQSIYDRSREIIGNKKKEFADKGYYEVNGKNNIMYKYETNEYAVIASSDPMYGKEYGEELNRDEVEEMLLRNVATANEVNSHIKYKKKDGNNTVIKDFYPYERGKEVPLQKTIYLTVSEDDGVEDFVNEVWNSIPDDKKDGVKLVVKGEYGSHYKEY